VVGGLRVCEGYMSSTIAVEELRVGMFIHLDGGWLSHPFPLSSFRLASPEQIQTLRGLGLARVRWSPDKSELPPTAEEAAAAAAAAADQALQQASNSAEERTQQQRREQLNAQREAAQRCERQHAEAAKAWREATDAVGAQPREAGRTTEALTRAMLSKMLVNQDIGIRLVAGGGDRAAAHALNTSIVALLMGRSLGLNEGELMDIGVGALLHDVGKLDLPERVRHPEGCKHQP
jgi:HD-GYP domain-containing protein (c-di-GMP phosphodiesterase class II)